MRQFPFINQKAFLFLFPFRILERAVLSGGGQIGYLPFIAFLVRLDLLQAQNVLGVVRMRRRILLGARGTGRGSGDGRGAVARVRGTGDPLVCARGIVARAADVIPQAPECVRACELRTHKRIPNDFGSQSEGGTVKSSARWSKSMARASKPEVVPVEAEVNA